MGAVLRIAKKIAGNSPTAVQSVKRAVQMGQGEPVEQAIAIMMDEHWRSVVHPDRVEGILAFTEGREARFPDPDFDARYYKFIQGAGPFKRATAMTGGPVI